MPRFKPFQQRAMLPERALARLEDMCVRAEHCTGELREKLRRWGVADDDAEKIVASLVRRRFVDDSRFAEAFTRDHYRFGYWGRRKIELALRAKKIGGEDIAQALDTIDENEYFELLAAYVMALVDKSPKPVDGVTRQKIFRRALARGYESILITKALKLALQ